MKLEQRSDKPGTQAGAGRARKFAGYFGKGCGIATVAATLVVGTCTVGAREFDRRSGDLPCEQLRLPEVPGADVLEKNICVSIAGEQPEKIGVEQRETGDGMTATTLFMEWGFDGISESLYRKAGRDAEPVTLITAEDGTVRSIDVRSHWRVGTCDADALPRADGGKIRVAVANAFHTPVVPGCDPEISDPAGHGSVMNSITFSAVSGYARAVGALFMRAFRPLRAAAENEVPGPEHPARAQPIDSMEFRDK